MSSFDLYLLGFAILIGGIAWALVEAGVPHLYMVIASVILTGIGILKGDVTFPEPRIFSGTRDTHTYQSSLTVAD